MEKRENKKQKENILINRERLCKSFEDLKAIG